MAARARSMYVGLLLSSVASLAAGSDCTSGAAEETCHRTASSSGSVLLQIGKSDRAKTVLEEGCTAGDKDPWATGQYVECCDGATKKLSNWGGGSQWHYKCIAVEPETEEEKKTCTEADKDPWASGDFVACCAGLEKQLIDTQGRWHYVCQQKPADTAVTTPTTMAPPAANGATTTSKILQWNVHYKNRDHWGMAKVVVENDVDIVGFCELTGSMSDTAHSLSKSSGRDFRVQPGRDGSWKGFGTDIFYDNGKWKALEGGVSSAQCSGSRSGKRAVNWVVLEDRTSKRKLVVGGTHISYCRDGCDSVHECELKEMYRKLEDMREKHNAPVVWMGDMNRNMRSRIMSNVVKGKVGSKRVFPVDDLVKTDENTYYTGGSAIDHILGESGKFFVHKGGRTHQGIRGRHLFGADHFPVFTHVDLLP